MNRIVILCLLMLAGCTVEQTEKVKQAADQAHEVTSGPVVTTVETVFPPAKPYIALVNGILIAISTAASAWGAYQRRGKKQAEQIIDDVEETAAENITNFAGAVKALDPVLTPDQKKQLSASMPEPSKQIVRAARAIG